LDFIAAANRASRKAMKEALQEIRSGKFAQEFIREMETSRKRYAKLIRLAEKHPLEEVGRRLRRQMTWENKNKQP
jgi:ketol-acid reductoisomerase